MFGSTWRVGSIGGIELKIDSSWLVIVVLIGYSFYARLDHLYADEIEPGETALLAASSAVAFFGSVLLHELAHSFMARARGIPVRGITLFLFGGATEAKVEGRQPRDEFLITIVGPLTSVALAGALGLVAQLAGDTASAVPGTIGYLAWLNLALAAFNLVPGLPLDGGRVLRSALWAATGSLERATRIAARAGQIVGWTLMAIGLLNVLSGYLGGLWLAAIGWFLSQAAQASYAETIVKRLLRGIDADDVMTRDLVTVPADLTVQEAIETYFLRHDHSAFPVSENGELVGLLSLRRVRQVPADDRDRTRVREAMVPLDDVEVVGPHTPMNDVMRCFERSPDVRVLVQDADDHVVGIVTSHDVARWLRRMEELGLAENRLRDR